MRLIFVGLIDVFFFFYQKSNKKIQVDNVSYSLLDEIFRNIPFLGFELIHFHRFPPAKSAMEK